MKDTFYNTRKSLQDSKKKFGETSFEAGVNYMKLADLFH